MSNFNRPVSSCKTTALTKAGVAASPEALSHLLRGRHTLTITATGSAVYVGDKDVSGTNGIKLAAGESITIPVATDSADQVYVTGACVITEWF